MPPFMGMSRLIVNGPATPSRVTLTTTAKKGTDSSTVDLEFNHRRRPLMMCFNGLQRSGDATRSQEIDRIIRKDEIRLAHEVKILLLGEFLPHEPSAHDAL